MRNLIYNDKAVSPIYGVVVVVLAMIVGIVSWGVVSDVPDAYFNSVNGSSSYDADALYAFEVVYNGFGFIPLFFIIGFTLFIFVFSQWGSV